MKNFNKLLLFWFIVIITLTTVLIVFIGVVRAEDTSSTHQLPMECDNYKTMVGTLMIDFEEQLVWEGQANEAYVSVFVNELTGTWTIVGYDETKSVSCMMSSGIGYNVP